MSSLVGALRLDAAESFSKSGARGRAVHRPSANLPKKDRVGRSELFCRSRAARSLLYCDWERGNARPESLKADVERNTKKTEWRR
jgi:hypothetical protein